MQVASFVTFAVFHATGGTLRLSDVFYVVGLLNLPKLWLALFFVKGVKSASETRVACRRIDAFLCQLEPHLPQQDSKDASVHAGALPPNALFSILASLF